MVLVGYSAACANGATTKAHPSITSAESARRKSRRQKELTTPPPADRIALSANRIRREVSNRERALDSGADYLLEESEPHRRQTTFKASANGHRRGHATNHRGIERSRHRSGVERARHQHAAAHQLAV